MCLIILNYLLVVDKRIVFPNNGMLTVIRVDVHCVSWFSSIYISGHCCLSAFGTSMGCFPRRPARVTAFLPASIVHRSSGRQPKQAPVVPMFVGVYNICFHFPGEFILERWLAREWERGFAAKLVKRTPLFLQRSFLLFQSCVDFGLKKHVVDIEPRVFFR